MDVTEPPVVSVAVISRAGRAPSLGATSIGSGILRPSTAPAPQSSDPEA